MSLGQIEYIHTFNLQTTQTSYILHAGILEKYLGSGQYTLFIIYIPYIIAAI